MASSLVSARNTPMTDPGTRPATPRRSNQSGGAVWKSGLLALSLATVLSGAALLHRAEGGQQASAQAVVQSAPQVIVVQQLPTGEMLVRRDVSPANTSSASLTSIPTMPARPVFRQPITRTRGS